MAVADEFGFEVEFVSEFGEEVGGGRSRGDGNARSARPGRHDHGPRRPRQDVAARLHPQDQRHRRRGRRHHAAHRRLRGRAAERRARSRFLDTPGHEAFTAMRARGAQVTDIVVLVVAADDRVMPQTIEAIDHAKAANVPIVVAINKIDLPAANLELVRQELSKQNLVVEECGGKYDRVEISAKKGTNVDKLLEMILLPGGAARAQGRPRHGARAASCIEARVEQGRGVVASVLVQKRHAARRRRRSSPGQQFGTRARDVQRAQAAASTTPGRRRRSRCSAGARRRRPATSSRRWTTSARRARSLRSAGAPARAGVPSLQAGHAHRPLLPDQGGEA